MDTHLLFLSHAVGTETVQEYVHALSTSLFIGKTRTSNITVFIHLFQQSTFYAEVIFYHICHFQFPFFRGRGLAPSPDSLLLVKSEHLGEPADSLASFEVERKSTARIDVVHDLGFLDKPDTNGVDQQRKLGFTRSSQRVAGERSLDFARDTAHFEVIARAERF